MKLQMPIVNFAQYHSQSGFKEKTNKTTPGTPLPQTNLHCMVQTTKNVTGTKSLHYMLGFLSLCSLQFQVKYQWLHFRTNLLSSSTKKKFFIKQASRQPFHPRDLVTHRLFRLIQWQMKHIHNWNCSVCTTGKCMFPQETTQSLDAGHSII